MKLNGENINFIQPTIVLKEKLSSSKLAAAIISASYNSQTNVRNVVKICI